MFATSFATVLLPAAAGPSIAMEISLFEILTHSPLVRSFTNISNAKNLALAQVNISEFHHTDL
ncbi:MAG TPA: hypothetical protein VK135_01140 [Candidatus Dormibacteraeota bacterium]|nr:hypothetical protein [Candidatus Dormibacteraeota bacterium]